MSSQAEMPLSATDGTYSTAPIGASGTTDPNSASAYTKPSPSAPLPPSAHIAAPPAGASLAATSNTSPSVDSSQPMETEEKSTQPHASSSSTSSLSTSAPAAATISSSPLPATTSTDTAESTRDAPPAASDTAENKLDSADDEYVMVDKPTDGDMKAPDDSTATQTHPTAVDEEKKTADSTTAAPTTPHKLPPAKRRSELESDLNITPTVTLSRSGRQRKPPAAFTPFVPSERPHVEQTAGRGTPLADISNIVRRIDNSKSDSPEIRRFYSLCFPLIRPPPHKTKIKSVLKTFSGLSTDEQRHSAKGKLKRMWKEEKAAVLYRLMLLMDLDYVEGEEGVSECHEAIMRWLDGPVASGRDFVTVRGKYAEKSGSKKRKRPSSGGRSDSRKKQEAEGGSDSDSGGSDGSDSDTASTPRSKSKSSSSSSKKSKSKASDGSGKKKNTLRTANSFNVFTSAKREEVKAAHPTLTGPEVHTHLAAMWRELPAEEKEVYQLAAKRLREDAMRDEEENGGADEGTERAAPSKSDKTARKSGEKKRPAAKKQKKAAAAEVSEDGSGSGSGRGSDSSDGTSEESSSDSGTEDEDDVKAKGGSVSVTTGITNGSVNGGSSKASNTAQVKSDSNASTPSNAAGETATKQE